VTVILLQSRERLADKLERARRLVKVHVVTPAHGPADRETWAQRNMDAALEIYRKIVGTAALKARLRRAIDDAEQSASTEERK
jgi:hypothetical protein